MVASWWENQLATIYICLIIHIGEISPFAVYFSLSLKIKERLTLIYDH